MSQGPTLDLSVVVPAWNEAARLPTTLARLLAWLPGHAPAFEVIVVSDGSDDGTDETVAALASPHVRLLRNERRRGKGAAVRTGMLAARGARVLFTDADLATPIEDLTRLQAALDDGADVAIGSRRLEASVITRDQGPLRRTLGRFFPSLMAWTTGLGYADTQCGFKLFTRDAARRLFEPLAEEGFVFDVEVLARAREADLRVAEVPVTWESRAGSKVSSVRDPLRMTGALLALGARTDLPRVIDHQLRAAAGWGAWWVIVVVAMLLAAHRVAFPTIALAVVLPVVVYVAGRAMADASAAAVAALAFVTSAVAVAPVLPPVPQGLAVAAVIAVVAAIFVPAAVQTGRLRAPGATLLLFPGLALLGAVAGRTAREEGLRAGLPWALAGLVVVGLAAWAVFRARSVPLVLALLALATSLALVAAAVAGWPLRLS